MNDTTAPIPAETSSPLERETTGDTTTFEHFGRSWAVPTKRHTRHLLRMRDEARQGYSTWNLIVVETFLTPADFAAFLAIDPDEEQLDDFTGKIAEALGLKDAGNS